MSTILDALRQVEERIKNEAAQKAAEGVSPTPEAARVRTEPPVQPRAAASTESDEAVRVYNSLVEMLTRIQDRLHGAVEAVRAEAKTSRDEQVKVLAGVKNDVVLLKEAVQREFQKRDAEREAENAKLAALQAGTDALRQQLAETGEANAKLTQSLTVLRNDALRLREALKQEFDKRDAAQEAARDAASAALSAVQSQTEALKRLFAETGEGHAGLVQTVASLKDELVGQAAAVRNEFESRDAARHADADTLAELQSQTGAAKALFDETKRITDALSQEVEAQRREFATQIETLQQDIRKTAEEHTPDDAVSAGVESQIAALKQAIDGMGGNGAQLAQAILALQNDFNSQRETVQAEFQKRDAENALPDPALAGMQSQIDALKQALADTEARLAAELRNRVPESAVTARDRLTKDDIAKLHAETKIAYAKGDYAEALRLLDIINTVYPDNSSVIANRAQCLIGLGRKDEARELCDYMLNTLNYAPAAELKNLIRD